MKLFLGFILIGLSVYLARIFSYKYTKIRLYYEDFYTFNRDLINKVSFSNYSIIKIFEESDSENPFFTTSKNFLIEKKEFNKVEFISDEENNYLKRYLSEIGKSDRTKQVEFLSLIDNELREKLKKASEEEKKFKPLYIKLGFIFGLITFILFL